MKWGIIDLFKKINKQPKQNPPLYKIITSLSPVSQINKLPNKENSKNDIDYYYFVSFNNSTSLSINQSISTYNKQMQFIRFYGSSNEYVILNNFINVEKKIKQIKFIDFITYKNILTFFYFTFSYHNQLKLTFSQKANFTQQKLKGFFQFMKKRQECFNCFIYFEFHYYQTEVFPNQIKFLNLVCMSSPYYKPSHIFLQYQILHKQKRVINSNENKTKRNTFECTQNHGKKEGSNQNTKRRIKTQKYISQQRMFSTNSLKSEKLSLLIYMGSMILRNSPEYYMEDQNVRFILSVIDSPRILVLVVYLVSLAYLVVSILRLVYQRVGSYYIQIFYYIIAPILVYWGKGQIIYGKVSGNGMILAFYSLTVGFICCFMLAYPILQMQIKTNKQQTVNHTGYLYLQLLNFSFMVMVLCRVLQADDRVVVVILVLLCLLRSSLVVMRVNFDNIEIEYCSLLGEVYSWVMLAMLCLRVFYSLAIQILCWTTLLLFLYLTLYPQTQLTSILELKYIKRLSSFNQTIINYSQERGVNESRNTYQESELIQLFVCFLFYAKSQQFQNNEKEELNKCKGICMSKYFKTYVIGVIEKLINKNQKCTNTSNKNHLTIQQHSQNQFLLNRQSLLTDIYYPCQDQPQINKWQLLYKTLQSISQIQHQGYNKLRRLIIYNFSIINSTANHTLLRLHYLNVNYSIKQKYSYFTQIVNELTYEFLTKRMILEFSLRQKRPLDPYEKDGTSLIGEIESSHAVKDRVNNRLQTIVINNSANSKYSSNNNSSSSYCLKLPYQQVKPLSHFNLYYQQTQIEQDIRSKLQNIFSIQKEIISLTVKRANNKELLGNLVRKYQQTKEINYILQSIHNTYQIKSIMYKFILEYWIMNSPHVAINNLKMSNFKDLFTEKVTKQNIFFRKGTVLSNSSSSSTMKGSDKKMIAFVSGIKSFGRIVDSCEIFKQKMQLWTMENSYQKGGNLSLDKISIYDIMLPLWTQKHMEIGQAISMSTTFTHQSTKVHLVSCHQKKIYECSFNIYPVISNSYDLLLGLDIKYKQVERLCIYHNQRKVFTNVINNRHRNQTNITVIKGSGEWKRDEMLVEGNCIQSKEIIFGEEYFVLKRYKGLSMSRFREGKRTNNRKRTKIQLKDDPFAKRINPQEDSVNNHVNDQTTTWTFNSTTSLDKMINSRLQDEIRMNEYLKGTIFYSLKLKLFTLMHWSIPPFIMCVCLFLNFYTDQQLQLDENIVETKLTTYQNFLIVDTHLLVNLYYMKILSGNAPGKMSGNDGALTFLLEDVEFEDDSIYHRQRFLQQQLSTSHYLITMFLQHGQSSIITSPYFRSLVFDIQVQNYLNTISQSQNLQTIYTQTNLSLNVNRFFQQFKDRYEGYFNSVNSNVAIIPAIEQFQAQSFQYSSTFFQVALIALIVFISIAAVVFVFVYFDLQYHVQKLVLTCLDMPITQLQIAYARITQSNSLIMNSKSSIPNQIIQKIRSNPSNQNGMSVPPSQSAKQLILTANAKKNHLTKQIHDTFCQTISKCLPQLFAFCLVIIILHSCLILLIAKLKVNIENTKNFSNGVQKLAQLTALSNELAMGILLRLQNSNIVDDTELYLKEYFSADKMNFINELVSNGSMFNQLVFGNICNLNDSNTGATICPHYIPNLTLSYAQVISSNYRFLKQLFYLVSKQRAQPTSQIFASLSISLLNLIKRLSLLNRYVHQMIVIGRQNLKTNWVNPAVYFALIIVEMAFVVLTFNWFTYKKVYKIMKIYYHQAFTICPFHEMQKHRALYFYLNRAKQHKINYVSGIYELLVD